METLGFPFLYVDANGQKESRFRSRRGSFDGAALKLGDDEFPVERLARAQRFNDCVALTAGSANGGWRTIVFSSDADVARSVAAAINRVVSARFAEQHLAALAERGKADEYRAQLCPHCAATVDLSGIPASPQVYCNYCDAIGTPGAPRQEDAQLTLCDACGFFAKPTTATIFYFYFVLVAYGWRTKTVHVCHACLRKEAWKMLAGNVPFVLGVVPALFQLRRAYAGGVPRSSGFHGLETANSHAQKGRIDRAETEYERIERLVGPCAGVRFNHGRALLAADRVDEAMLHFQRALSDCANYPPAFQALSHCYERLGRRDDVEQLHRLWGIVDDDAQRPADSAS